MKKQPEQTRNIGREYVENVRKLRNRYEQIQDDKTPRLIVREEAGFGIRQFDARTKQQLPDTKHEPTAMYSVTVDRYFVTKQDAEAAADYLTALPAMAEGLHGEVNRLNSELYRMIGLYESQKIENDLLIETLENADNLHQAQSRFDKSISLLRVRLAGVRMERERRKAREELEPEFEIGLSDYGRGEDQVMVRQDALGHITEADRRATTEESVRMQREDLNRRKKGDESDE